MAKSLCLNMIVKNEMANLERCLGSVAPHIACWVIGDTGSTDGTQAFVKSYFAQRGIPGELHSFPFVNFEQARNAGLDCAYASKLPFDYLLFDDADMELVVEAPDFREGLEAPGYQLLQRAGISYWNTRLARRDAGARYHGVTHEYLDVPGETRRLGGVWYKDHASGSNRVDKFERDIRLLKQGLKAEPGSQRYQFYLAQSYRDAGRVKEAAEAYGKRATMGGWEEEAWYARLQQARCFRTLGDEGGFLREALAAFNQRPGRAEPLYDLANFYREKGMNDASVLFAEAGLALPKPEDDILFVEDYVYDCGLREEYSIAANYARDPVRWSRGFAACNWLALNREIPSAPRELALSNLYFYLRPVKEMLPSFAARPVGFTPPEGWRATNPSVARRGDEIVMVQRTVNYNIDPAFPEGDDRRFATPGGEPITTRNFLLRLDADLTILSSQEILLPEDMPPPAWPLVRGFEDMRPFVWRGALWCVACARELTEEGWCELVLARIDEGSGRLADWRVLRPEGERRHEKNWMPRVTGDALELIYSCDPTRRLDDRARRVGETVPPITAEQFRGGSQAIPFDGGSLALIHEARVRDGQRNYKHRFVAFDAAGRLRRVSKPFVFHKRAVEFAAGLAWHPDGRRLLVSYGVDDAEAWIATVEADDVRRVLEDVERLPGGEAGAGEGRGSSRGASEPAWARSKAAVGETTSLASEAAADKASAKAGQGGGVLVSAQVEPVARSIESAPPAPPREKISGFVISYNRAAIIETCLRSLRFVDELIVVDKSSGDGTLEIARKYADKLVVVPWTPTADDTREYALSLCSHDLIVYLDDDECLSADAIRFILKQAVDPDAEVFQLPSRDYYLGHYDERRRDWPDYKARFFRRGVVEFSPTVHGCVVVKSAKQLFVPADSPICFHHLTSPNVSSWVEKANRYTSQPDRDSWFAKSAKLSAEFVHDRLGYWFNNLGQTADDYPAAYALMRVAYDVVDRLKRWEVESGMDGEREFAAVCARLGEEYDRLEKSCGVPTRGHEQPVAETEGSAPLSMEADEFLTRLGAARRKEQLGCPDEEVIAAYLEASDAFPTRAEALHDAARYCRNKGMNERGCEFAARGLAIAYPKGAPQVEDWIYEYGLQQEFSIVANYAGDPAVKDRGFAACNWLALNRAIPEDARNLALSNLHFYLQPATNMMPSFTARPVAFAAPEGFRATNPSVVCNGDEIGLVLRCVNCTLDEFGTPRTANGAPFLTRNFLLRLDWSLRVLSFLEILSPERMLESDRTMIDGVEASRTRLWRDGDEGRGPSDPQFEDMRPFLWRGDLWCVSATRELSPEGYYQQVMARFEECSSRSLRLRDWRVLRPQGSPRHEKNWMPRVAGEDLRFIHMCDPTRLVDDQAKTVSEGIPSISADAFRGGSQAIAFDGGWLALVHETRLRDKCRHYRHRFVWFDATDKLEKVSRPFFFQANGIEFAAGLAWHPNGENLLASYGVGDSEAWVATVDPSDVRRMLDLEHELSWAAAKNFSDEAVTKLARHAFPQVDDVSCVAFSSTVPIGNRQRSEFSVSCVENQERVFGAVVKYFEVELPVINVFERSGESRAKAINGEQSTGNIFIALAPFLAASNSPKERRDLSRAFDARIAGLLGPADSACLPRIHSFYEVLSDDARHDSLIAATASMRAAGHPVTVWSYSPPKLEFLRARGVEVRAADDVVPRDLYQRIVAGAEIRYFSDVFRYAVLYEHGGLWMDSDVVLLRPFPFRGDHFFNLQWGSGVKNEHFVCGNVIYAEPHSRHLRNLYEMSLDAFFSPSPWAFGEAGPKLLSDYIASDAGAELRERVFSPVFFNPIDWTEIDRFDRPITELADYLEDDRVYGIHLWNARNPARGHNDGAPLLAALLDPAEGFPTLTTLADRFNTDKNRHTGNRHFYSRVYDRLLAPRRFSMRRLMEIGLCRGLAERNQTETPSVTLWQTFFPYLQVIGVDLTDFSRLNNERFQSFICDQSKRDDLRRVAGELEPGSLDVIIDDGSHASFDEQLTLREFFPLLADGGWFFVEDLDWQPPGEDPAKITLTKTLLREIRDFGAPRSIDPHGIGALAPQFAEILFFDSHYELSRARLMGGLAAIRKRAA